MSVVNSILIFTWVYAVETMLQRKHVGSLSFASWSSSGELKRKGYGQIGRGEKKLFGREAQEVRREGAESQRSR